MYASTPEVPGNGAMCPVRGTRPALYSPVLAVAASSQVTLPAAGSQATTYAVPPGTPSVRDMSLGLPPSRSTHRALSAVLSLPSRPPREHQLAYLPRASATVEGVVRLVNRSRRSGEVLIAATDDTGRRFGPVTVPTPARNTVELTSSDLEQGNPLNGLWSGIGTGTGDWRLALRSSLDVEVLSYAVSPDGLRTPLHETVEPEQGAHWIGLFPGAAGDVEGRLRLVNSGENRAGITVQAADDAGGEGTLMLSLPAGTSRWLTSRELASGAGSLGAGDWRLTVKSSSPVEVLALASSSSDALVNLPGARRHYAPATPDDDGGPLLAYASAASVLTGASQVVWRLPGTSSATEGLLRLVNRSSRGGEVTLHATDETDWRHDPVTVPLAGGQAVTFTGSDLEFGNLDKGLATGFGASEGAWRIEVRSTLDVEVLAFARSSDGALSPLQAVVPRSGAANRHAVPVFDSSDSELWLINREPTPARVHIAGVDEDGRQSQPVRLTVPGGASRTLSSELLSWGGPGVNGFLGAGTGRWRLSVWSDRSLEVMALEVSPSGRWANVSAGPTRSATAGAISPLGDLNGDGKADVLLRHVDGRWFYYPMDGRERLDGHGAVPLERDLHWRLVGLGDLDGDGRDDVLLRHTDGRWRGYLMDGRTVRSSGSLGLPSDAAWGVAGLGDLDGDGTDDVVLRHTDGRWRYAPLDGLALAPAGVADLKATANLAWRFAGIGDLDGDGRDDLLLRHDDGRWYFYRMVGARLGAGRGAVALTRNLAWSLAGLGDFNGDGTDDALLRHVNGNWTYYPLSGRTVLEGRGSVRLTRNRSWSLRGVADLGGDGRDDVLLRHDDGRWFYYAMSAREPSESGSVPLTRNLAWTPGGGEPAELEAGTPEAGEDTANPEEVFETLVSDSVVQGKCVNCHVSGGVSSHTRLVLVPAAVADHMNVNRRVFEDFVADVEGGAELILNKVQGVGHGGGEQLPAETAGFDSLRRFLSLLGQDTGGPAIAPSALFDSVRMEPPRATLRRAAIVFAGRVPTEAEYAAVEDGGFASLRPAIRGLMEGPAFHEFLIRSSNDRLLTDRHLRDHTIENDGFFVDFDNEYYRRYATDREDGSRWERRVQYGAGRAPLELIAHVVENDLPYTEVLTADYVMANADAARAYGAATEFEDPGDVHEFRPSEILSYYRQGEGYLSEFTPGIGLRVIDPGPLRTRWPHAGVLNAKVFLKRYPTTPTNRNRARARWTYYHFLGLDIEKSASRTTDPVALADTDNPTMHNPACTVCHTVMDPVAGAFQNYGDLGFYRDQSGGLDSLDGFYKFGSEDDYPWAARRESFEITGRSRADRQSILVSGWLAGDTERILIAPRFDPPLREDEEEGVYWHMGIDHVEVHGADGRLVKRFGPQSLAGHERCGQDEPSIDEESGAEFYESWFCPQELFVDIAGAGRYEVEVVLWEAHHGTGVSDDRRRLVALSVGGYQQGDTWYRDMRQPGFDGEAVPESETSLQWLAKKIAADDRFAEAAVRFWWPAVMGQEVVEAPEDETDRGFRAALLAANAQALEVRRLADGFRRGFRGGQAYNAKDLLVEMAVGKWFRAASMGAVDSTRERALGVVGARRLLTPEELARKTVALTGFQWGRGVLQDWQRPHQEGETLLTASDGYRLLYGGIDSDGITDRARDMTSVMAGVAQSHALESSCPIVMRELYLLPDEERRLFGGTQKDVSPVFEFGGGFDVEADRITNRETLRLGGRLRAGANTVRLSFVNDDGDGDGDRNLRVDSLLVRDAAGRLSGKWELEDFEDVGGDGCNHAVGGHFAFHCNGSVDVPITVKNAGRQVIEVTAWADQYGDEPARLEVVVESNTRVSAGSRAIKEDLATLYRRLLGPEVSVDSLEVRNAYGLFVDVWKRMRESGHDHFEMDGIECDWGADQHYLDGILDGAFVYREDWGDEWGARYDWDWDRINVYFDRLDMSDRHGVARTWTVVLAYLLMDYRYLYL